MLSEAQKRIAQLLGFEPDTTDEDAIRIIDECLRVETRKGALGLARHLAWVLGNVLQKGA